MIERYFSVDMPFWRFSLNALAVSCGGLVPLLLIYVALRPGFGPMLMDNGLALRLFLRQVVTNGLLAVFTVNYLGFFLYAVVAARNFPDGALARLLLIDPPLRVAVFIVLHGLIYFLSADWFGSFGGDHWLALRVVGPTLAASARFSNLSGVYFYATLGSAIPVYATAIHRLLVRRSARRATVGPLASVLRGRPAAVVLAFGLFAVSALLLTGSAATIVILQA